MRDELDSVEQDAIEDVVAAELPRHHLAAPLRVRRELEQLWPDEHLDGTGAGSAVRREGAQRRVDEAGLDPSGQHVPRADELGRPAVPGREVELLGRPFLDNCARTQERDSVGQREASSRSCVTSTTVTPRGRRMPRHLVPQLGAEVRIDVRPRLVEQDELRCRRERPRERDALLLPARELVRVAAAESAQVDEAEELRTRARRSLRGRPKPTFSATVRCGNRA